MKNSSRTGSSRTGLLFLGICLFAGLATMGYLISHSAVSFKRDERTVVVKGLSEREMPANIVIWPISFSQASNDMDELFQSLENNKDKVNQFLVSHGFTNQEISSSSPRVTDRYAQGYDTSRIDYRYTSTQTITVYSDRVEMVRDAMNQLADLGKAGVATTEDYENTTEFLFTGLNDIKPGMIEESTKNARASAEKFAMDSDSRLGKIKTARQGQFSIVDRDSNTPHIKKIRVVSTVEYYLVD
jgi:hypothetical protein